MRLSYTLLALCALLALAASAALLAAPARAQAAPDLVFANENQTNNACENQGGAASGTFACSDVSTDTRESLGVAVADLDGANGPDLAFANRDETNRVCLSDGAGGYACSDVSADTRASFGVAVADLDGANGLDLAFANDNQTNRVCLSDGAGGYACSDVSADTRFSRGVAVGEFGGSPLPVELTAFSARLDGTAALLAWETASETDNAGFQVEHRAPGAQSFAEAGWVEGMGTTSQPQRYGFRAENLSAGTHSFRLRQVDFDGAFAYSPEVEVEVALEGTHALAVWPNPVGASGTVRLTVAESQAVTVALYDALGRRVALLHEGTASGTVEVPLPEGLPAGVYLVRAEGAVFAETVRVSVVQ